MKKYLALLTASLVAPASLVFGAANAQPAADAIAQAKATYPLKVCAVSSEALGSMGEPYDHVHQEAGKPDRLVRMCCKGCVKTFKKDPAKYLARIDAAAKKASTEKAGDRQN